MQSKVKTKAQENSLVDPQKVQSRIIICLGNPTSGSPPHGTESRDSDAHTPKYTPTTDGRRELPRVPRQASGDKMWSSHTTE